MLIAGLNSSNHKIRHYCWENLPNCYLGFFCHDRQKKSWINILFDAYQKPNFVLSQVELIDYIFHHLKSHDELGEFIICKILKLLKSGDESIIYIEWTNLVGSLLSSNSSQIICKKIVGSYSFMLKSSRHSIDAKRCISSGIFSVCYCSVDYLSLAMFVLVEYFNSGDEELRDYTAEFIAGSLSDVGDIRQLDQKLIEAVSEINPNFGNQNPLGQILSFLVYVIAQLGDCPRSQLAATAIITIVNKNDNSALAVLVKQLLYDYGIVSLRMLKELHDCLQKKIKIDQTWNAYDQMCFLNQTKEMQNLWSSKNINGGREFNTVFLIASCFIKQNKLGDAYSYLLASEESYIFYPLHTFLKAEIKFGQGNFSEAIGLYDEVLMYYPYYIQAKIKIYQAYQKLQAFSAVDKLHQEIKLLSPQLNLDSDDSRKASNMPMLTLEKTVFHAQQDMDQFVKTTLALIKGQSVDKDIRTIEVKIIAKFEEFKNKLYAYFGKLVIVGFFNHQAMINWSDLSRFPHQLPRFMNDTFIGILQLVLPKPLIGLYKPYQSSVTRMRSLDHHMIESEVFDFVEEKISDPSNFLKANAEVFSAYEFIQHFAFSEKMENACALGLSGDISGTYSLLVGLLQFKHWELVYDEVDVEPSGKTEHTNEFMAKVLKRKQAVIMFVSVIVKKEGKNNPTLDEIKYLLSVMQGGKLKGKVYFVFGAYAFLPIYMQVLDPIHKNRHSLGYSFKPMLGYIVNFFDLKLINKNHFYRLLMDHMLCARIKVNIINNATGNENFNN